MDISLQRQFLSSFKLIGSDKKVCDISADIVVPDTKEDILRVVQTSADYKIRSKDVESGMVAVHGELRVNVAYVPEAGAGLRTLSADVPFECKFDVETADSGCAAIVEIEILSVDTRILNPRKVMVSAQVNIGQKCYCNSDFAWCTEPTEKIKNAFFNKKAEEIRLISLVTEKTFSIEDEMPLQNSDESSLLLSTQVRFSTDSAEAVGSKLIVKGHANISAVYYNESGLYSCETSANYSQIFELSERDIVPDYKVVVLPTGDYFELSAGKLSFDIHAVMQIVCTDTKIIEYIDDAYVCSTETILEKENKDVCVIERSIQLTDNVQISNSGEDELEKVLHASGITGLPRVSAGEIIIPIAVEVMYSTCDGQIRSFKCHSSAKANIEIAENEVVDSVSASIIAINTSANGNEIIVDATICTEACVQTHCMLNFVCSAQYNTVNNNQATPSVYLCVPGENDLWTVSKQYNSSIELIKKLNELDDDHDICNRLIIVPRIK